MQPGYPDEVALGVQAYLVLLRTTVSAVYSDLRDYPIERLPAFLIISTDVLFLLPLFTGVDTLWPVHPSSVIMKG